jgi:hypothetical protein
MVWMDDFVVWAEAIVPAAAANAKNVIASKPFLIFFCISFSLQGEFVFRFSIFLFWPRVLSRGRLESIGPSTLPQSKTAT